MKKIIKLILSVSVFLALITACKKSFLDEKVLDAYAPSTLNNKLGFESAAIGLYNQFSSFLTTTDDQTILGMFQLGTDIVWNPAGRSNGDARPYHNYATLTSTDNASRKLWNYLYRLISNANIMIQNAETSTSPDMTKNDQNAYSAEGRFFRAYAYNMLATLYGRVPLITQPLSEPKTDFVRAPLDSVNKVIINDLLFGAAYLPDVSSVKGKEARANKYMARQLLAEVYLRVNQPALAEKQCDTIINSNKFKLITARYGSTALAGDAFSDMFRVGKQRRSQGNTEAIWVLEQENPTDVPGGSSGNPQQRRIWGCGYHDLAGMVPCDSLGGRGLTRLRLDNWVAYGLYQPGDMRNSRFSIHRRFFFNNPAAAYNSVRGKMVPYGKDTIFNLPNGTQLKIFANDTVYKYVPYTLKWGQFDPRDEFGFGMWKDFILMRLGETYLLRAEARFKQGNSTGAADDINVLRNRASAPTVTAGDMTLNFILDERVRELIGEENRRMTLVRTGTLVERARRLNGTTTIASGNIETTNGLQDFNTLLPIPQTEIDLNKDAKLEQNPGY